jgi:hypothetical protein
MTIDPTELCSEGLLTYFKVSLLSLTLVTLSFWLQGDIGIGRADEGFLWYGTIQTASGGVPIRDFQSYDPGRYYWGAAWFKIFGDESLRSLRISCAIFQSLGISFALLVLRRVIQSWFFLALTGTLLTLWLNPYYRVFEYSFSMAAVYFAVLLLEQPSIRRHFIAGLFVGLAGFFGRNLGLYALTAFLLLIAFIHLRVNKEASLKRALSYFGGGILLGYSPLLLMLVVAPGFGGGFIDSIAVLITRKTTNLSLPIPWPWLRIGPPLSIRIFFLIFPLFTFSTLIYLFSANAESLRGKEPLTASVFVSLPFMHYAFSRADLEHLSACIPPLLIGLISLPRVFSFRYRKVFNVLCFAVIFLGSARVAMATPYYAKLTERSVYVKKSIGRDTYWLRNEMADRISAFEYISNYYIAPDESILFAPYGTTYYPLVKRKSPLWEIYFLWNETGPRQEEQIEELRSRNVNWIILSDKVLDGREELGFRITHPLLWKHFIEEFDIVGFKGEGALSHDEKLLHRKSALGG